MKTPLPGGRDAAAADAPRRVRWLLFVHQLPATPSNLRVRTWRRLQQLGALALKQAVYLLPDTPAAREDLEWLKAEVKGSRGDASIFSADSLDAWSDDALIEEFRRAQRESYAALGAEMERVLRRFSSNRSKKGRRAPSIHRSLDLFRERLSTIERTDFFGAPGRDGVMTLLKQLEDKGSLPLLTAKGAGEIAPQDYRGRLWVTRPRPGVDRMSSAWLIKRFIDSQARFGFAADRESVAADAVPFDMFGVNFSHQGGGCTFETLCAVFNIQDRSILRLGTIVHDLDLKDSRFSAPEAPTVAMMLEGLQLAVSDDDELLAQGMTVFESLYRAFERSSRSGETKSPLPMRKMTRLPEGGARH